MAKTNPKPKPQRWPPPGWTPPPPCNMAESAPPSTPIDAALQALDQTITNLQLSVDGLSSHLAPALSPETPNTANGGMTPDEPDMSNIEKILRVATGRVQQLIHHVDNLNQRCRL